MAAEIPDKPVRWLMALCAVLFLLDFVIDRHPKVPGEGFPEFHAIVGFVAFTLIVLGAKQLRRLIKRPEDFYGSKSIDTEAYPAAGLGVETAPGFEDGSKTGLKDGSKGSPKDGKPR